MPYSSKYTDRKIAATQKAAEIMCERRAAELNMELPYKFWRLKEWMGYFGYQLRQAAPLMKEFGEKIFFETLKDSPQLSSLRSPWFRDKLKTYARKKREIENIDLKTVEENDKISKMKNKNIEEING